MGWSTFVTGALAASFTCLGLMAVGYSIPFWTSFEQKDITDNSKVLYTVYTGVWYLMACKEGESGSCASKAIKTNISTAYPMVFNFISRETGEAVDEGAFSLGIMSHSNGQFDLTSFCMLAI